MVNGEDAPAKIKRQTKDANGAVLWAIVTNVINLVSRIVCIMVLSRILSKDAFGEFALATSILALLDLCVNVGMGASLVQVAEADDAHFRLSVSVGLFFSGLCLAIANLSSVLLAELFDAENLSLLLQIMSFGIFVKAASSTYHFFLVRELLFLRLGIAEVLSYFFGFAVTAIALGTSGYGVWSLAAGYVCQNVLLLVSLCVAAKRFWLPGFSWSILSEHFGFNFLVAVTKVFNYAARNGDYIVVGYLGSSASLGIYSRAYTLMQVFVTTIVDALEKVAFPVFSRIQKDRHLQAELLCISWQLAAMVYLPLGIVASFLARPIVRMTLGPGWDQVIPIFSIFSSAMLFRAGYKTAGSIMRANRRPIRLSFCQAIYCGLVLIGSSLGFVMGEIQGAAVGVLIALASNYLLMNISAAMILDVPCRRLVHSIFMSWPMTGPCLIVTLLLRKNYIADDSLSKQVFASVVAISTGAMLSFVAKRHHLINDLRLKLKSL